MTDSAYSVPLASSAMGPPTDSHKSLKSVAVDSCPTDMNI